MHAFVKSNYAAHYSFTTVAGLPSSGGMDGTGSQARFAHPSGVAVDSAGNLYVADTDNHTLRKVTPAGMVTTLAGMAGRAGGADGTGSNARFQGPSGVAVDSEGNVYLSDTLNHTIRKVTMAGVVTTLAGLAGKKGSADDQGGAARFDHPRGVAVDAIGNVYVADTRNHAIRKVTAEGAVTTLAGGRFGCADGAGRSAQFYRPEGVAVDRTGNLYVTDTWNNNIRKVSPEGTVTTLAGMPEFDERGSPVGGSADGTAREARFRCPSGVAVDRDGNVYVVDRDNRAIRKMTPTGGVTTLAGFAGITNNRSADGTGSAARFWCPEGVTVDAAGNLYVADTWNNTVRKVTPAGMVTTLAGLADSSGSSDGTGNSARFYSPCGVAVDRLGNVYVADCGNEIIRKMTPAGVVTTMAGQAGSKGAADGTGMSARFHSPFGVAVDSTGNLYVADSGNNTIRRVTPAGVVTTLAGLPPCDTNLARIGGSADGTGSTGRFDHPSGVAVDAKGNVYVADRYNNTIRKLTPEGVVTTLAGLAGAYGSADGTGSAARFCHPHGLTVDRAGNLYVADNGNNTVRKVTPGGMVTTVAGLAGLNNTGSTDGTGTLAQFRQPFGVAVDTAGSLYVADSGNHTIRKVTPAGVVTTLAGLAGAYGSADGTGMDARFNCPQDVAVDQDGNLYVADTYNRTIRKGWPSRADE